jgi:hypothetical protein
MKSLGSRLGWAPWYLLSYVALILSFACLFSLVRADFFHSTVTMEPEFIRLRRSLGGDLQQALVNRAAMLRVPLAGDSATVSGSMQLGNPEVGNDELIHVTASTGAFWHSAMNGERYVEAVVFDVGIPVVALPPKGLMRQLAFEDDELEVPTPLRVRQLSGPQLPSGTIERLLEGRGNHLEGQSSIPANLMRRLAAYRSALAGRPADLGFKSAFPRMLYLSVITINSLGYGDIVPLTQTARLLVGLESFLGVVLLGAFASTLTSRGA